MEHKFGIGQSYKIELVYIYYYSLIDLFIYMYKTNLRTIYVIPKFTKTIPIYQWHDGTITRSSDVQYEYDGIKILEWDNHRDGRLVGKMVVKLNNYTQKEKCEVMKQLIDSIKVYGILPEEVIVVSKDHYTPVDIEENLFKWCKKYPLTSLNMGLGEHGKIPDEPFIFAMSDIKNEIQRF
jgi:hypothetical protein